MIFSYLPLASIIDNKIYVVHGGISDRTSIEELSKIKREKYVSILKPPILDEEGQLIKNINKDDLFEWRQVLDALWSDPKQTAGVEANLLRGGGCLWGKDVTETIAKKYHFNLIIRSHECKESGYEYAHGNRILTIFSASNYYDVGSNNGAYAKIVSANEKPIIAQFRCKKGNEMTQNFSLRERVNIIEKSAIRNLLEKFLANRTSLLNAYKQADPEATGLISLNEWCSITGHVLELNLPWRILHKKLVKLNENNEVFYESPFDDMKMPVLNQKLVSTQSLYSIL
jgi:serine/threonine-protein phosphatase with EF-hand domain